MAWLKLLRIAALPTAISNILMAYLVANGSWAPGSAVLLLVLASSCLYLAGMVLNDVFDVAVDSEQRPQRPLPSGQIQIAHARIVGFALLALGIVLAAAAGYSTSVPYNPRPLIVGAILATLILLYDGALKTQPIAPALMGACRSLNILLGASTAAPETASLAGWSHLIWWIALYLGVLIAGTTWMARNESRQQSKQQLLGPATTVIAGLALLAMTTVTGWFDVPKSSAALFPLLVALVGFPILRTTVVAFANGTPRNVQMTIVSILRSLIVLDAALCWLVAPSQLLFAFVVLSLLLPSVLLGRVIATT